MIGLFFVALFIVASVAKWQMRKSIRRIPLVITSINMKMDELIAVAPIPSEKILEKLAKDMGDAFNLDVNKVEKIVQSRDGKEQKRLALRSIVGQHLREAKEHSDPSGKEALGNLIVMKGIMHTYSLSIDDIKDSEYMKLEEQLKNLVARIDKSSQLRRYKAYTLWRDGIYSFRLFSHYFSSKDKRTLYSP